MAFTISMDSGRADTPEKYPSLENRKRIETVPLCLMCPEDGDN